MRHLGVCYDQRKFLWDRHRLVDQAQADARDDQARGRPPLEGTVQIHAAYLGGERNGGKSGRGSENKLPFVIAVETSYEGPSARRRLWS